MAVTGFLVAKIGELQNSLGGKTLLFSLVVHRISYEELQGIQIPDFLEKSGILQTMKINAMNQQVAILLR